MKHVLAKVDNLYFAVPRKLRFKFQTFIWPCCLKQHINLLLVKKCLKIEIIFFSDKTVLVNNSKNKKNSFFEKCHLISSAKSCFNCRNKKAKICILYVAKKCFCFEFARMVYLNCKILDGRDASATIIGRNWNENVLRQKKIIHTHKHSPARPNWPFFCPSSWSKTEKRIFAFESARMIYFCIGIRETLNFDGGKRSLAFHLQFKYCLWLKLKTQENAQLWLKIYLSDLDSNFPAEIVHFLKEACLLILFQMRALYFASSSNTSH